MRVEPRHTPEELAALARAASSGRVARRLLAVRLAMLGATAEAVGPQVLLSGRQVKTWVARYNAGGAESLADRAGRGRKPPLTPEQEARLAERLRAGPTESDGGVCTLRGADVRRILADEFGVRRCLQAVYDLLHRLSFEPLRPRPAHPGADPAARESFKKVYPSGSPVSPPKGPARGSRSGSPTRRASGKRVR